MKIEIKKTADFKSALNIAKSLPDYFNEDGLKKIEEELPRQNVYGAYVDGDLVGCASYQRVNDMTMELAFLMINSQFQGRKIGTQLVNESLEIEKDEFSVCQVKTLAETVKDEGYARTRKFYKKLGFIPIEIIDPYPGWGLENPCQIMVKFLKK